MDGYNNYGSGEILTEGVDDFDNVKINLGDPQNQINNPDLEQQEPSVLHGVNIDMDESANKPDI